MPELSEVRIMADYINTVTQDKKFLRSRKSQVSKVKTQLGNPFSDIADMLGKFRIEATSRGKN